MCRLLKSALVCATFLTSPSWAAAAEPANTSDQWQFAVTPYLWLPSVSGTLRFTLPESGTNDASTGPYNYLENLKFLAMLQGEARKGDWSLFADTIYLSFGRHGTSVKSAGSGALARESLRSGETSLKAGLVQLGGGHTIARLPHASIDAIAGMRYLGVSGSLDASLDTSLGGRGPGFHPQLHVSQRKDIFNGFIGMRGRVSLTDDARWYVPFYLDVGTGTSNLTWQAMTGIGYAMKWGDVNLSYCYLEFRGSGDDFVQRLRLNGPALSATFRF